MIKVLVILGVCLVTAHAEDANACDENPCGLGTCKVNTEDSTKYRCVCPLGYKESDGACVDVDECSFPAKVCGGKGSVCTNTEGSFECSCKGAFYWDGYQCLKKGQNKKCMDKEFPEFLVKPQEEVQLEIGDEVKLTCVAAGHPAPNVYWVKGVDRKRMGPMSLSSSIFYLPSVTKQDIDVYECVLEDCCSGRIARAKVELSVPSQPCANPNLKLYGMVWEYKTWDHAKQFCEDKGLIMGVIRTEADRELMRKDAQRSYVWDPNAKKFANKLWMWIGVSDREEENIFKTIEGENVDEYAKWLPNTPDNWLQLDEGGQDVVAVHRFNNYWDDSYSFHLRPFACECPTTEPTESAPEP